VGPEKNEGGEPISPTLVKKGAKGTHVRNILGTLGGVKGEKNFQKQERDGGFFKVKPLLEEGRGGNGATNKRKPFSCRLGEPGEQLCLKRTGGGK